MEMLLSTLRVNARGPDGFVWKVAKSTRGVEDVLCMLVQMRTSAAANCACCVQRCDGDDICRNVSARTRSGVNCQWVARKQSAARDDNDDVDEDAHGDAPSVSRNRTANACTAYLYVRRRCDAVGPDKCTCVVFSPSKGHAVELRLAAAATEKMTASITCVIN